MKKIYEEPNMTVNTIEDVVTNTTSFIPGDGFED